MDLAMPYGKGTFKIYSLYLLIILFFLFGSFDCTSKPVAKEEKQEVEFTSVRTAEPNEPNVVTEQIGDTVTAACNLLYKGRFSEAETLINQAGAGSNSYLSYLEKIIAQYKQIQQKRDSARIAAHQKELEELENLKKQQQSADANNVPDVNDVNDVNDLAKTLSVIARAAEFASPIQKKELLDDTFIKQTFRKAMDKAGQFEAEGKWLDSYLLCYSWLTAIDSNNKQYSDYAQQLVDKAAIFASFQDSPCETSSERYKGVAKQIFVNAVEILNEHYVNSIIDYKLMITKAITRCGLLAEVLSLAGSEITAVAPPAQTNGNSTKPFTPPDKSKLDAWSRGLAKIQGEVDKWPLGVDKYKFLEFFDRVLELNKTTAELPETILIAQFAEAAFLALDPYTVIVWPRQKEDFEKMITNEFTGIGIEISKPQGLLTVSSLLPDTPAYASGLDAGDIIEAVDGIATKDMSLNCAVKYITGPAGTNVKLTVRSPGEEKSRQITITRARITVGTIRGWQRAEGGKWLYFLDDKEKIGYVRITSFSEKTSFDLEQVLKKMEAEGLKGLILDLRFNSGGLLNSATEIADKFISTGPIVGTKLRYGFPTYTYAKPFGTHPDYPLVILINSSSASASEIVAGALADKAHSRAVLVGERTHGKGSVQVITSASNGGAQLRYTMAYYLLPSGQRVESQEEMKKQAGNNWGVGPDVEVKLGSDVLVISDELKQMLDTRRDNDMLVRSDHKKSESEKKYTLQETLESDPQLAIALFIAKAKLAEAQSKASM
jgi:carboxyl-terminal processing protease